MSENQIKSRKRVAEHGEVFTAKREVNAMLDLVKEETDRIDSRFLEPACGNGNFLVEILSRKLEAARKKSFGFHPIRRGEKIDELSLLAVSSIYGFDIMQDNVEESHVRMLSVLRKWYEDVTKYPDLKNNTISSLEPSPELIEAWNYILDHNIQRGDFLKMQHPETGVALSVYQWDINGKTIHYTGYLLSDLIDQDKPKQLMLW